MKCFLTKILHRILRDTAEFAYFDFGYNGSSPRRTFFRRSGQNSYLLCAFEFGYRHFGL